MAGGPTFIAEYRQAVSGWLAALDLLLAARREWDALDLGNTLTEADFVGTNAEITLAELTAAVSSVAAINTFFLQGHATNLYAVST